jgi:hypothetical protein
MSFMKTIGFGGFDDPYEGILPFFLAIVFTFASVIVGVALSEEILQYNGIELGQATMLVLFIVVPLVASFLAVYWKHAILIVLFVLITVAAGYGIYHSVAVEKGKYIPAQVRAKFLPSPEKLEKVAAMYGSRLIIAKYRAKFFSQRLQQTGEIVRGTIVTVIPDSTANAGFTKVNNKGKIGYIGSGAFTWIRIDRSVKLAKTGYLLDKWAYEAKIVREIPKGERVILTGNSSDDGLAVEITHNGEKGWLAAANVKFKI